MNGKKQQSADLAAQLRGSATITGEAVGLGRLLSAMVYDGLLIVGCLIALGFVAFALNAAQPIQAGWKLQVLRLAMLMLWGGFYAYFCSRQGQTLGMRAWKLVLSDGSGHCPRFGRVLWRWAVAVMWLLLPFSALWLSGVIDLNQPLAMYAALLVPISAAYLWRYVSPHKRSLIDILSGTQLLRVQENPYPKPKSKRRKQDVS